MDVTVVGAGLGGLAAAVGLHRAGHAVRVLERSPQLREAGAGIGIMPNGVLALDALGLGEPVRARAGEVRSAFRDRLGRPLLATDQAAVAREVGAPLVVVPRRWLHGLLVAALPGGTIRTDSPVAAVRPGPDGVEIDGHGRADVVIAADGAASRLRAALFPTHPGLRGSGEHAARAIATAVPPGLPLAPGELLDRRTGDRFGCLPLTDGDVYWYATWRDDAPAEPADRRDWLVARRHDWHPCVPALIGATPADGVHVVETVQLARPLPALAVGRVALLGDAAHAMTPDLGQGACQAFEDAVALAVALDGADVPAALRHYDALRRPRTTALQHQCRTTHRLLTLRGPAAALRDTALRAIPARVATRALASQLRAPAPAPPPPPAVPAS